jgi:hypothetical protein
MKPQTGLHAKIEILCETEQELLTHLSVIRANIKKQMRRTPEFDRAKIWEDQNCYGSHLVKVKPTY